MHLFSNEADVIEQGVQYLRIISFSYVLTAITMIYLNIMRSVERVIIATIVYLVSLIVNILIAIPLIFGLFGLEPMGIRGAAYATLAARVVGVFRAGGDINFGLFLDTTTMWCGSILCGALAAFVFKLPIPVVYIILMSDEVIKIPLTTWRYKSMKWVRNVTR